MALRITCQDKNQAMKDYCRRTTFVSVHMENLQYLVTKIFNVRNGLSPKIMIEVSNF